MPGQALARPALWLLFATLVLTAAISGCGKTVAASGEPEVKVRLQQLLELYRHYVRKHGKGPANEQELKTYGQSLSPAERASFMIGDDLEGIFVSPRDNQKFKIRWNLKLDGTGNTRAVAWEATPQNGRRYAALSMLYVEEYDEETFASYNR
jgi:hypothetical protein